MPAPNKRLVPRLGRKTRLSETQRDQLWSIFAHVRGRSKISPSPSSASSPPSESIGRTPSFRGRSRPAHLAKGLEFPVVVGMARDWLLVTAVAPRLGIPRGPRPPPLRGLTKARGV